MTFASLCSFCTSSATLPTITPPLRLAGSSTCTADSGRQHWQEHSVAVPASLAPDSTSDAQSGARLGVLTDRHQLALAQKRPGACGKVLHVKHTPKQGRL